MFNGMLIGTAFEAMLRYTILPLADGTAFRRHSRGLQIVARLVKPHAIADCGEIVAHHFTPPRCSELHRSALSPARTVEDHEAEITLPRLTSRVRIPSPAR